MEGVWQGFVEGSGDLDVLGAESSFITGMEETKTMD